MVNTSSATRQARIKAATLKGRQDWEDYTLTQEQLIYDIMLDSSLQIERQIAKYTSEGKVIPARLPIILDQLKTEMRALRPKLYGAIKSGISRSVDYGIKTGIYGAQVVIDDVGKFKAQIGTSYIGKDGKLRRYNPTIEPYADSAWAKLNGQAVDALLKYRPDGSTLAETVWKITNDTERIIRRRITQGVLIGESPAAISRDIRGFLMEPDKLFRRVRDKETGKLVLSKAAKEYRPGRGVYRSSYKNAMRVARTEYARAHHEGTLRYGHTKSWIRGYISRTTSGNPAPYDASVDGKFFPKNDPPNIPYHPNCMCYAEIVYDEDKPPATAPKPKGDDKNPPQSKMAKSA